MLGRSRLGRVLRGHGNDGRSGLEGARSGNTLGTYLHGPVLARNPALADYILRQATGQTLAPLDLPDQAALRHTYLGRTSR